MKQIAKSLQRSKHNAELSEPAKISLLCSKIHQYKVDCIVEMLCPGISKMLNAKTPNSKCQIQNAKNRNAEMPDAKCQKKKQNGGG